MQPELRCIAVHYYYLLKEDDKDQQKLWSLLTSEKKTPAEPVLSLGLTQAGSEPASQCRIIQRAAGDDIDYCLLALPDLTAIEAIYKSTAVTGQEEAWRDVLARVDADRTRVQDAGIGVFGETTLLAAPVSSGPGPAATAKSILGGRVVESDLDPETFGEKAVLAHILEHDHRGRDYYALATEDIDLFLSGSFPQMDAQVKKLVRVASHFGHQRRTIIEQRNDIDKQVSALLHQEVVSGASEAPDTRELEQRITSLSRMFGILATDSLMVRQAEDRIAQETGRLESALALLLGTQPGSRDEIGRHYMSVFKSDLKAASSEARHLDFSRGNAQAAIEVVRTQVELLRAGEEAAIQEQSKQLLSRSLVLQNERLSLQVAAGFVEFVLVFYYVLKSWEGVVGASPVEHTAPLLLFFVVGAFSSAAAVGTHFLAQALHRQTWKSPGLWISAMVLVLSLAAMVIITIDNS
ncbi:MAG: hypothetical protein WC828_04035 [Thermoleophilia bacterium]|jgi:hypothetical protein